MWLIDRRRLSWTFSILFSIVHRQPTEQLSLSSGKSSVSISSNSLDKSLGFHELHVHIVV